VIYYEASVDYDTSVMGTVKLVSVHVDGTMETVLTITEPDLYEYGDRGTEIQCFQMVGDRIYFSYGAYGGTGNFYQGGKIASVNKDGSDFQLLAGTVVEGDTSKDSTIYQGMVDENFYVALNNQVETLYFSRSFESQEVFQLDIASGEVMISDFVINKEKEPFLYQDSVINYENASISETILIPQVDYSLLNLPQPAAYTLLKDIQVGNGYVYYKMEASDLEPTADIGWREGTKRVKTLIVRQLIGSNTAEILCEY
jgi:hypothetical protein